MERKGRIRSFILTLLVIATSGCSNILPDSMTECTVILTPGNYQTRALVPDEEKITDISLMVFNEHGSAEECIWTSASAGIIRLNLAKGQKYSFRACANLGYRVYADHISELDEVTCYLAYPDEYQEGIPMAASLDDVVIEDNAVISLPFERIMSKISLRMDRRKLSEDVKMYVRSVKIGNCPKSAKVFSISKVEDEDGCFARGFAIEDSETDPLNMIGSDGRSGEVSLYMLENMQGEFGTHLDNDHEKVFDENDHRRNICSYIEMEMEYLSSSQYSKDRNLIYRFYLGDGLNNLDIERNCHYRITVSPEDDGLKGDGWRVDKSGLDYLGPVSFKAYPSSYINCDIGDTIHIWCEFTPHGADFDVGIEYMEEDKAEGIYDYVVDEDGHGAVLHITGPGTGLIYMEAGDPINDAALFIIEVNKPS